MSPSAAAVGYKPLQACPFFMGVGLHMFSLVDLCFFTPSECIHVLYQECVYCSFLILCPLATIITVILFKVYTTLRH